MLMKNLSRRNRTILYVITVILIMSMVISALVSFSPVASTAQGSQPGPLIRITATAAR